MAAREFKIGEVARRTGLTARAVRYYEELQLLPPAKRQVGGHRIYDSSDLERLYRIGLLRELGTPLAGMDAALDAGRDTLRAIVSRHLDDLDARMSALGRAREKVGRLAERLDSGEQLDAPAALRELRDVIGRDASVRRRITLLVYRDLETAHDFLVDVFGLGPGPVSYGADGRAVHGVVLAGDGLVWLHPEHDQAHLRSPLTAGCSTHCMAVFVDDLDEHYDRVRTAGAAIDQPPRTMPYGVREYDARDCEGGLWSFMEGVADSTEVENE